MSTLEVKIVLVDKIEPHLNADALEFAIIEGWQCIVKKNAFKAGDKALYIPIDSILPQDLENRIFGQDSKIKLNKSRVKTIKIRGSYSQGLLLDLEILNLRNRKVGEDVKEFLGITKYEPPVPEFQKTLPKSTKSNQNINFGKYTSLENIKNFKYLFQEDDDVIIAEKIHGTNFRAGWVPCHANTLIKKIKKFLKLLPEYEFVYGSHNVQLNNQVFYNGYYEMNVYAKIVTDYDLKTQLRKGEVIYGEIYGPGIQKGYHYGIKEGNIELVVFDMKKDGEYIEYQDLKERLELTDLELVPILFEGKFKDINIETIVLGDSVLAPSQKVREGIVIRDIKRNKILKAISPEYLMKDNTDFH